MLSCLFLGFFRFFFGNCRFALRFFCFLIFFCLHCLLLFACGLFLFVFAFSGAFFLFRLRDFLSFWFFLFSFMLSVFGFPLLFFLFKDHFFCLILVDVLISFSLFKFFPHLFDLWRFCSFDFPHDFDRKLHVTIAGLLGERRYFILDGTHSNNNYAWFKL